MEETARDVIVPLRSSTWPTNERTNERYGAVMDMEMHSREVTVPRQNRASEWSSRGDGDTRYESKTHEDTSPTPESKQLTLWGLTVSSWKPRLFEVSTCSLRRQQQRRLRSKKDTLSLSLSPSLRLTGGSCGDGGISLGSFSANVISIGQVPECETSFKGATSLNENGGTRKG